MTLDNQRRVDVCAGTLLRFLLAPLARIVSRPTDLHSCSTVTVLKLPGAGSLAIAYPSLLALQQVPHIRQLRMVTTQTMAPFAHTLGIFDEILTIEARTVARVFRCEVLVDLEMHSRLTNVFCLLTCAQPDRFLYRQFAARQSVHSPSLLQSLGQDL